MNTVRGIPLHLLHKSGFFPALETLARKWQNARKSKLDPLRDDKDTHYLSSMMFLMACLSLIVGMIGPKIIVVIPVIVTCILAITAIVASNLFNSGRLFARELNDLDRVLNECHGGMSLISLPPDELLIQDEINRVLKYAARRAMILQNVSSDLWTIEEERNRFVALHAMAKKFGFNMGPYGKFFNPEVEAQTELTK